MTQPVSQSALTEFDSHLHKEGTFPSTSYAVHTLYLTPTGLALPGNRNYGHGDDGVSDRRVNHPQPHSTTTTIQPFCFFCSARNPACARGTEDGPMHVSSSIVSYTAPMPSHDFNPRATRLRVIQLYRLGNQLSRVTQLPCIHRLIVYNVTAQSRRTHQAPLAEDGFDTVRCAD